MSSRPTEDSMICVEGLHFSYPGKHEDTIRGLDFEVRKGEIFGFLGPNGAGKTTLLEATVSRLRGELDCAVIEGDVATENDADRIRALGYRPDEMAILPLPVSLMTIIGYVAFQDRLPVLPSRNGYIHPA